MAVVVRSTSNQAGNELPLSEVKPVLNERAKVNLVRDEELAKLLPVRETVVEIDLADGTHLSERVSAVRGTPRNPMTRNEVIEKARDLTVPVLGPDQSTRLIETIFAIESVTDVRNLRRLLQRAG